MTPKKTKKHEARWRYPDKTGGKEKDDRNAIHMGIVLPTPLTNPLTFTVNVAGCNNVVAITATLADDVTGATIDSEHGTLPPPSTVTVSAPAAGDYTLTVELQCGSNYLSLNFDVDLPAPLREC